MHQIHIEKSLVGNDVVPIQRHYLDSLVLVEVLLPRSYDTCPLHCTGVVRTMC